MAAQDLNQFAEWHAWKPDQRTVTIEIKPFGGIKVFVQDRDYPGICLMPKSVPEIDFPKAEREKEIAEFERLREKFEPQLPKTANQ